MILSSSHVGLSSRLVGRNRECPKCWAPWVSSRTFETWRSSNSSNSSNSSKRAVTAVTAVSGRRVSGNNQIWRSCSGATQTYHLPFHLSPRPKMPSHPPHTVYSQFNWHYRPVLAVQAYAAAAAGPSKRGCAAWPHAYSPTGQPNPAYAGQQQQQPAAASSSQQPAVAAGSSRLKFE